MIIQSCENASQRPIFDIICRTIQITAGLALLCTPICPFCPLGTSQTTFRDMRSVAMARLTVYNSIMADYGPKGRHIYFARKQRQNGASLKDGDRNFAGQAACPAR